MRVPTIMDHGHAHGHDHEHGHGHDQAHDHMDPPRTASTVITAGMAMDGTTRSLPSPRAGLGDQHGACGAAVLSIAAAALYFLGTGHGGWVATMVHHSSAAPMPEVHERTTHVHGAAVRRSCTRLVPGHGPAQGLMYYVSGIVGAVGIAIAFVLHLHGPDDRGDEQGRRLLPMLGPIARGRSASGTWMRSTTSLIRTPLWVLSHVFHLIDKLLVDGLVNLAGWLPRAIGRADCSPCTVGRAARVRTGHGRGPGGSAFDRSARGRRAQAPRQGVPLSDSILILLMLLPLAFALFVAWRLERACRPSSLR
jgi:hypothetical protein